MDYDWKKILKTKSGSELNKIASGNSHLPQDVMILAKNELERRGINENNINQYLKRWRYTSINSSKKYYSSRMKEIKEIFLWYSIPTIIITIIWGMYSNVFNSFIGITIAVGLYLGVGLSFYLINKIAFKKSKKKLEKLRNEIDYNADVV